MIISNFKKIIKIPVTIKAVMLLHVVLPLLHLIQLIPPQGRLQKLLLKIQHMISLRLILVINSIWRLILVINSNWRLILKQSCLLLKIELVISLKIFRRINYCFHGSRFSPHSEISQTAKTWIFRVLRVKAWIFNEFLSSLYFQEETSEQTRN